MVIEVPTEGLGLLGVSVHTGAAGVVMSLHSTLIVAAPPAPAPLTPYTEYVLLPTEEDMT